MTAAMAKFATDESGPPETTPETFRSHLSPRLVTTAVRHRMAAELTYEQVMWSVLILSTCLMFALIVLFIFAERDLPGSMQRESVRPVFLALMFALLFLHIHYRRQRRFVMTAPVTAALVVREKDPLRFDEATSLAVPRVLLRYFARPVEEGSDELHHSADAHTLWAELDGFSARFERTVHAGDYVSLLYDPTDPEHVRVVEFERGAL